MIKKFRRTTKYEIISKVFCDDCNQEMHYTGITFPTYPQQLEYKCEKCNKTLSVSENTISTKIVYTEEEIKN